MKDVSIEIRGRQIGPGRPVYIVAELSANHAQSFEKAAEVVKVAKAVGADAIKLQTYTPDTITLRSNERYFRISGGTPWDGRVLHDLYSEAYTPWEWQPKLKAIANRLGIDLFSSAFDPTAVDFLEKMDVPAHKVASFEIVDLPLIEKMAHTRKPLIISTGMATFEEIKEALTAARSVGAKQIALLKCASAYPALPESMNLRTIPDMAERFQVPVGISDHTLGSTVSVVAVTLGACIVEKHLTLSRSVSGPDSAFSLEPDEFKTMVEAVRTVEKSLGQVHYGATDQEVRNLTFRRSLFVVKDVEAGKIFTEENVRSIRPGHGLAPKFLKKVLGKCAARDIERGTPLEWSHIQERH